jgi:Arc/MetJ-type ribon-helix-helix transcriptional regulator
MLKRDPRMETKTNSTILIQRACRVFLAKSSVKILRVQYNEQIERQVVEERNKYETSSHVDVIQANVRVLLAKKVVQQLRTKRENELKVLIETENRNYVSVCA